MTEKILYWSTLIASALCLLLFIISAVLVNGNQIFKEISRKNKKLSTLRGLFCPLTSSFRKAFTKRRWRKKTRRFKSFSSLRDSRFLKKRPPPRKTSKRGKQNEHFKHKNHDNAVTHSDELGVVHNDAAFRVPDFANHA